MAKYLTQSTRAGCVAMVAAGLLGTWSRIGGYAYRVRGRGRVPQICRTRTQSLYYVMRCNTLSSLMHKMSQEEPGEGNEELFADPKAHFIVVSHTAKEGAKKRPDPKVGCKWCNHTFSGGSTRQRAHLTSTKGIGAKSCDKVPDNVRRFYQTLEATKNVQQAEAADAQALDVRTSDLPALAAEPAPSEAGSSKRPRSQVQRTLSAAFNIATRLAIDREVLSGMLAPLTVG
jgi:hypothetical protein